MNIFKSIKTKWLTRAIDREAQMFNKIMEEHNIDGARINVDREQEQVDLLYQINGEQYQSSIKLDDTKNISKLLRAVRVFNDAANPKSVTAQTRKFATWAKVLGAGAIGWMINPWIGVIAGGYMALSAVGHTLSVYTVRKNFYSNEPGMNKNDIANAYLQLTAEQLGLEQKQIQQAIAQTV